MRWIHPHHAIPSCQVWVILSPSLQSLHAGPGPSGALHSFCWTVWCVCGYSQSLLRRHLPSRWGSNIQTREKSCYASIRLVSKPCSLLPLRLNLGLSLKAWPGREGKMRGGFGVGSKGWLGGWTGWRRTCQVLWAKGKHWESTQRGSSTHSLRRGCPSGQLAEGPLFQKRGFYTVNIVFLEFWKDFRTEKWYRVQTSELLTLKRAYRTSGDLGEMQILILVWGEARDCLSKKLPGDSDAHVAQATL